MANQGCNFPYGHIPGEKMDNTSRTKSSFGRVKTAKDIGEAVRQKRKEQGILQEKAAGLAGVGTKFFSQLENGKETAEIGKILQVLRTLGLEIYIYPRSQSPCKGR
jgi:HTH-type transcriptional regulator / antitoxin HipB